MGAWDIVVRLADVFVWPLVVLVLALVYRRPITGFIERLRRAKGLGVDVELADLRATAEWAAAEEEVVPNDDAGTTDEAQEVEIQSEAAPPPSGEPPAPTPVAAPRAHRPKKRFGGLLEILAFNAGGPWAGASVTPRDLFTARQTAETPERAVAAMGQILAAHFIASSREIAPDRVVIGPYDALVHLGHAGLDDQIVAVAQRQIALATDVSRNEGTVTWDGVRDFLATATVVMREVEDLKRGLEPR